jgi:molybdate transport system substrate-binding protein
VASIRMLCAGATRATAVELAAPFARATGIEVALEFGTAGAIRQKILDGARPDAVIASAPVVAGLERTGKLAAGSAVELGRTGVGVGVRAGAPLPDLSSVDAVKRALLAARAVAYTDPASGGTSGIHMDAVLERLGIRDAVNAKAVLVFGGYAAERVSNGEADLVVQQSCEIVPVKGVTFAGPLPPELQAYTTYTAALVAGTPNAEAARAWIAYLAGPAGRKSLEDKGLEPPPR